MKTSNVGEPKVIPKYTQPKNITITADHLIRLSPAMQLTSVVNGIATYVTCYITHMAVEVNVADHPVLSVYENSERFRREIERTIRHMKAGV